MPLPSSFRIKYVDRGDGEGRRLPVLVSPSDTDNDQPSAKPFLLAVINALLVRNDITFPSYGVDTISLVEVARFLELCASRHGKKGAVSTLMKELPVLIRDGLAVPSPWSAGVGDPSNKILEGTEIFFEGLGLAVVNGCEIDPDDTKLMRLVRNKTTADLVTEREECVRKAARALEEATRALVSVLPDDEFSTGKELENGRTLADYNIQRNSTLRLVPRPSGASLQIFVKWFQKTIALRVDPSRQSV